MDSVSAANAASTTARAASTASTTSTSKTSDGKDFATLFADAKRDLRRGETLAKVDGHDYARIRGGTRDDQCVNLSGNARSGQAFDLIWRDGRQFHVYGGRGADHKVVEVGHKAATTTTTGGTDSTTAATGTTGTTGTTSTDASASTGTTSTTGASSTGANASDVTSSYTGTTGTTSDTSS
jgi:hypothetical protein